MKKWSYILLALFALVQTACVKEEENFSREGIILNLFLEDPETKTEQRNGDNTLNENAFGDTIDIFFYNETTGVVTKKALAQTRVGTLVQIQTNYTDVVSIFGTDAANATCGLFVVANFTGTYNGIDNGTVRISDIKNSLLPAINWETLPQPSFVMTGEVQAKLGNAKGSTPVSVNVGMKRVAAKVTFDMTVSDSTSEGGNSWTPDTQHMTVYMVYAMRKATLAAEPVPMPATEGATYTVGGSAATIVYKQYTDKELYDTGTTRSRVRGEGASATTVNCEVYSTALGNAERPFYTYPSSWEMGSSMEPYLKLIIPWTYGNTTRKYYYKIPFPGNSLERNHWYKISIDVQILGTEQADPPSIGVTYAIADWSGLIDTTDDPEDISSTTIPAAVIVTRYLTVPTTEYVLYNEETLLIPIQSSHDVEIIGFTVDSNAYKDSHQNSDANYIGDNPSVYNPFTSTTNSNITAVRPDYSAETVSRVSHSFTSNTTTDTDGWRLIVNGRESISFTHPLNRDLTSNTYDVAPYTIRFRVRHQGDASGYYSDIIIEQRPPIIIRPYANSGDTQNYGWVYVNKGHANGDNNNNGDGSFTSNTARTAGGNTWRFYLGTAGTNLSNSGNANKNMFVIETSVLPSSVNYVLGDPRSRTVDNLIDNNYEWRQSAPAVGGGNRRLTYYYPAGDANYDEFIAPKIRFASSFAATQKVTYADAKRRCASYQEDGHPAGRWRLPTVAEITYIATLNADKKIVRLLGNTNTNQGQTTDYWCNNGFMTVYNGTGNLPKPVHGTNYSSSDTKSVRCVYDDWYWENTVYETVTKNQFTWGDQLRSDVRISN